MNDVCTKHHMHKIMFGNMYFTFLSFTQLFLSPLICTIINTTVHIYNFLTITVTFSQGLIQGGVDRVAINPSCLVIELYTNMGILKWSVLQGGHSHVVTCMLGYSECAFVTVLLEKGKNCMKEVTTQSSLLLSRKCLYRGELNPLTLI